MLVLSRCKDEKLVLGPFADGTFVTITNVETRGDKVRLGIEAPKHIPINRKEVFDSKVANGDIVLPEVASDSK